MLALLLPHTGVADDLMQCLNGISLTLLDLPDADPVHLAGLVRRRGDTFISRVGHGMSRKHQGIALT